MGVTPDTGTPTTCSRCGGPSLAEDEVVRHTDDDEDLVLDDAGRYCVNGCHL